MQGQPHVTLSPQTLVADLDALFSHAGTLFDAASARRHYCIAGQNFHVASDMIAYLNALDQALASKTQSDAPETRLFVGVAGEKGCPTLQWSAPNFEERKVESILAATRYKLHYFQPQSFWQVYDRETATGLQILQGPAQYPAWDLGSPLRNFLQWRLGACGGALVHAGTLGVGDKGVLLAGAGGSGKSGTVLSGILAGLTSVGDDYVFVMQDTLRAFALFETLKQDEGGLQRLSLLGLPALPKETNWQHKYQFFMGDLGLAPQPPSLALNALLLPKITGSSQTHFARISAKDAFLALAPSGVSQIPGDRPLLYATAADIARRLPCYELRLGARPAEVSSAIKQFILDL